MDSQIFMLNSSALPGYEDMVECPYNRAHQIMSSRMQSHLYKCRKNYKNLKYVQCPFNETHDFPEQELPNHVKVCPDRESLVRYKLTVATSAATFAQEEASSVKVAVPVGKVFENEVEDEDLWDAGPSVRAYNPRANASRTNVIRKNIGMTPSQKKAFKEAERQRLGKIRNHCELNEER
ncbi:gametocyte-specific factor 1 homolog [Ochlerotatus camptorhynchus]|uniref:gametocyte-specific factor 1 homolog n=1 Tax=Ochlerotatus camptorhynchus TaxID=644619 RepID=UPI0031DF7849